jgi:hypothetical protein
VCPEPTSYVLLHADTCASMSSLSPADDLVRSLQCSWTHSWLLERASRLAWWATLVRTSHQISLAWRQQYIWLASEPAAAHSDEDGQERFRFRLSARTFAACRPSCWSTTWSAESLANIRDDWLPAIRRQQSDDLRCVLGKYIHILSGKKTSLFS